MSNLTKITTWNCAGALRNKFHLLSVLDSDIYIIQECENPLLTASANYKSWSKNHIWIGDNKNKGLGVFAKENIKLEKLNWSSVYSNHEVKYFLPVLINGTTQLLATWCHHNSSPTFAYIGQFWKYLQINKSEFKNIIIAGDFNSNSIWDKWDRWWNHSDVIKELNELNIKSLYHLFSEEEQGKEKTPTFYLQKNINKPYHIDYIFAKKTLISTDQKIQIESFEKWESISDHCPVTTTFFL